ncbi:hypothetical protein ABE096_12700 [Robertmurraya massiliosenegalensis]
MGDIVYESPIALLFNKEKAPENYFSPTLICVNIQVLNGLGDQS